MSIKFSKALLNSGKDYQLTPYIILHHPIVKEVMDIDDSPCPDNTYIAYINLLLADPYFNMVMLDDMGKNYLETSPFEVFCIQWDNYVEEYQKNKPLYDSYGISPVDNIKKALNLFVCGEHEFTKGHYENGDVAFYDVNDPRLQISKEIFECLYEWVKSINKIDYSNKINPADENARRILIEDMRDEIKKAKRRDKKKKDTNTDYFGNLMSAAMFCRNGGITPFNINDCKLYWLTESMHINSRRDNANHILDGVYHGTISSKDIKKDELEWAR